MTQVSSVDPFLDDEEVTYKDVCDPCQWNAFDLWCLGSPYYHITADTGEPHTYDHTHTSLSVERRGKGVRIHPEVLARMKEKGITWQPGEKYSWELV